MGVCSGKTINENKSKYKVITSQIDKQLDPFHMKFHVLISNLKGKNLNIVFIFRIIYFFQSDSFLFFNFDNKKSF